MDNRRQKEKSLIWMPVLSKVFVLIWIFKYIALKCDILITEFSHTLSVLRPGHVPHLLQSPSSGFAVEVDVEDFH